MQIDNLENILARRKEIEGEIVDMLKEIDPTPPMLRRGKEQFYQKIEITPAAEQSSLRGMLSA